MQLLVEFDRYADTTITIQFSRRYLIGLDKRFWLKLIGVSIRWQQFERFSLACPFSQSNGDQTDVKMLVGDFSRQMLQSMNAYKRNAINLITIKLAAVFRNIQRFIISLLKIPFRLSLIILFFFLSSFFFLFTYNSVFGQLK